MTSRVGLPLVVETSRALRRHRGGRTLFGPPRRKEDFGADAQLEIAGDAIAAGGDRVEDIRILGGSGAPCACSGGRFASPDALLDFLTSFPDAPCWAQRPPDKPAFIPPESAKLQALAQLNRTLVGRAAAATTTTATIDHDGTIIESHKRDARVAYEGTRGYQPLVALWAEEQLVVADEFRDGNVAGGEDPLRSARRAFETLPPTVTTRYFRGDSADYYDPLLKYLVREQIGFAISADMSPELRAVCTGQPEGAWQALETRERERVDVAEVEFTPGVWPKDANPLRYIALRFTPLQAELFAGVAVRYHAVVSNRRELTPAAVIEWHRGKAGTIEQVHRVLKDELGAGVMPCQLFGANAAWFRINVLTFNLLTALKRRALPERYRLARPKRLRFEVFTLPGKLAVHESQLAVQVSAADARLQEMVAARQRLLTLRESTPA